ncbi:Heavy metal-associated isoprenylated plant protein 26 [Spatholobus suberectus]|nr:Heavy metal-associated isoprenylated plant protein 26 [Spatholobus suberectus]
MDAKSPEVVAPSEPLKYQTWFLKVSIHCEGCRRKVKKVLQSIDGVFTTTVDPQQQKVTVTGSVGVETLIRKLVKAGKHAEIWPENLAAGKGKNSGKEKKQKKNEQGEPESAEDHSAPNAEPNTNSSQKKRIEKGAEKRNGVTKSSGAGESEAPEPENKGGQGEGGSGKKKKKKGQSGGCGESAASSGAGARSGSDFQCSGQVVGQMYLSPTRQQSYPYPATYCYPPLVYLPTHNRLCPMGTMGGPSYYVSPLPYTCAGLDHDPYHRLQSTPFVPFEIFSDENANGCSIM